mmetsp:Transcript_13458/g.36160  ORF Transcript_13458/g.36160 Transcript_13458/m.36160 type:complete len:222 (+) Transcript_13458:2417-3082(+)
MPDYVISQTVSQKKPFFFSPVSPRLLLLCDLLLDLLRNAFEENSSPRTEEPPPSRCDAERDAVRDLVRARVSSCRISRSSLAYRWNSRFSRCSSSRDSRSRVTSSALTFASSMSLLAKINNAAHPCSEMPMSFGCAVIAKRIVLIPPTSAMMRRFKSTPSARFRNKRHPSSCTSADDRCASMSSTVTWTPPKRPAAVLFETLSKVELFSAFKTCSREPFEF